MGLTEKKCVPCEGKTLPLAPDEQQILLKQVPDWKIENNALHKEWKFPDFKSALEFVNKIGGIAENEGHHPDIELSWGKVKVVLTTHAINGLSENDFIMAAKINALI